MTNRPTRKYRPIAQQDQYGCGIAAVAVATGRSYSFVKRVAKGVLDFDGTNSRGLKRRDLELLGPFNLRMGASRRNGLAPGSIVLVRIRGTKVLHYLVSTGSAWMDSLDYTLTKRSVDKAWLPQKHGRLRQTLPPGYLVQSLHLAPQR